MFVVLRETISHLFHPRKSNRHRSKILHPEAFLAISALIFMMVVGVYRLAPFYTNLVSITGNVLGYASDITVEQVVARTNAAR